MPIHPDNRQRYPADWPAISLRIRAERALWQCECVGECGRGHAERCAAIQGAPVGAWRVVLTVAHLNHEPECCDESNLRAMCQACHLAYDAAHHRESRARRALDREIAGGQGMMFEEREEAGE